MKFKHYAVILLLTLAANAAPPNVAGRWKVHFAGLPKEAPKTIGSMILDLQQDSSQVTGTVYIGTWPGKAPVADSRIEDDRITFSATGTLNSTTGIPTCEFEVTVRDDEMTVRIKAVKNGGGPIGTGQTFEYKGKRE